MPSIEKAFKWISRFGFKRNMSQDDANGINVIKHHYQNRTVLLAALKGLGYDENKVRITVRFIIKS